MCRYWMCLQLRSDHELMCMPRITFLNERQPLRLAPVNERVGHVVGVLFGGLVGHYPHPTKECAVRVLYDNRGRYGLAISRAICCHPLRFRRTEYLRLRR